MPEGKDLIGTRLRHSPLKTRTIGVSLVAEEIGIFDGGGRHIIAVVGAFGSTFVVVGIRCTGVVSIQINHCNGAK